MKSPPFALVVAFCALILVPLAAHAQRQVPDREFTFENGSPAYAPGGGPPIMLSTTNSWYVEEGALDPFAMIAASDGFTVRRQDKPLTEALDGFEGILVIANAYLPSYQQHPAMEPPSAFSASEIEAIRAWVENGGKLLLLADHAPFGGGASELAAAFGFVFLNGHVVDAEQAARNYSHVNIEFTPQNGLNTGHPITDGSTGRSAVSRFFCFGGQAFIPADGAQVLLTIPEGWDAVFTYRLRDELTTAMRIDASGMAQGAAMEYGKGRLAIFGEAGAFTAQILDGEFKFGMNTAQGSDNPEFILATLRWLAGYRP
jgi:hypothetical protein